MKCDFHGWASKNNLKCEDGLTIKEGALTFSKQKKVPLVWNHIHDDPEAVLGHAVLENRKEGVYAYGFFNKNPKAAATKEAIANGDIVSMSIWATNLSKNGSDVTHGVIREVSLVLAAANPGAFIESTVMHGVGIDEDEEEAIIYTGEQLFHGAEVNTDEEPPKNSKKDEEEDDEETVQEVFNTLTEKQKAAVAIVVGAAIADAKESNDEEEDEVKHNAFTKNGTSGAITAEENNELYHSAMKKLFADAKNCGSLKEAYAANMSNNEQFRQMMHSLDKTGMDAATGNSEYGFNDPEMLFPEYKNINGATPEFISRNMDWVDKVLRQVHRSPFSRIRSIFADITEDEARARGYIKEHQKKEEVFTLLKRTTSPATIYKLQKMNRDDVIDITDLATVAWIRAEMRVMLNEEVARAILIGDGRPADDEYKISEANIRPVVSDVPLFNTIVKVSVPYNATEAEVAELLVDAIIRAKKKYKGTGRPTLWTMDDYVTDMLLLKDTTKRRIYENEGSLATTLRVSEIVPVEPMEGATVTVNGTSYPLIGTMVNLADYNVGTDKGGEVSMFDDFDIRYNQFYYLLETRMSGALIKPFSAVTFVLDRAARPSGSSST